jgi:hypothetical protein
MLEGIRELRKGSVRRSFDRRVIKALALNRRGEVRSDGLSLKQYENRLEIEWSARQVHPWDRDLSTHRVARLFAEQCLDDTAAALERAFSALPEVNTIQFKVTHPESGALILTGSVARREIGLLTTSSPRMRLKQLGVIFHLHNWEFESLT